MYIYRQDQAFVSLLCDEKLCGPNEARESSAELSKAAGAIREPADAGDE